MEELKKMLILLFSVIFCNAFAATATEKWMCNNANLCVVTTDESSHILKYDSQNICRLSCGSYGSLWPQPTSKTFLSSNRAYFDPSNVKFTIEVPNGGTSHFILDVSRIFLRNIRKECHNSCSFANGTAVQITVSINSLDTALDWDTDESYILNIANEPVFSVLVNIKAKTIFGARHGIETLSQLITGNINGLAMVANARITDKPIFKHRGLLLDTARNYIPVRNIKSTLDAMATAKLNVFHWHATDSHSFPIEIKRVPELQRLGAYSPHHIYSRNDIQYIIKYAKLRGIRIIMEIDAPSHAGNGWQFGPAAGLGDLAVCINQQPWRKFCIQPPCGQLNPVNKNVYTVLKEIFEDISELVSIEETIHMGGDEVFLDCWNSTKEIVDKLKNRGMDTGINSFMKLWAEFHSKNLASWDEIKIRQLNKTKKLLPVILWSSHLTDPEVIEQYLPKDRYIIQTWVESSLPLNKELIKKGYRIIASTKDAWYLDHGFWGITKYYNWKKVYENQLTRDLLGGETCMWTEYVDENSLDARIWPRAGAAAERLWSDPSTNAVASEPRFFRFRERLIARGIKPDAIVPKWCTINEGQCT